MRYKYKKNGRGFVSISSFLARQFLLPNPFTNIFPDILSAEIANCIFGTIFIRLAYLLTKTWYISRKGEEWIGSLGFFINYCFLTFLLLLISKYISNIYWLIAIFIVIYIIVCIIEGWLLNKKDYRF